MCALQLAKHMGLNCVGHSYGANYFTRLKCGNPDFMHCESRFLFLFFSCAGGAELDKLRQLGLNVQADPIDAQAFGSERPKLAINLAGGNSAANLASLLRFSRSGSLLTKETTFCQ